MSYVRRIVEILIKVLIAAVIIGVVGFLWFILREFVTRSRNVTPSYVLTTVSVDVVTINALVVVLIFLGVLYLSKDMMFPKKQS